ncbi:MAG: polymer-forming cytoskeletal protein [Elusimicrobia bacterium]|nr:polymer-forming cytoskeletal protein [Elusimicrobiota bacterium]
MFGLRRNHSAKPSESLETVLGPATVVEGTIRTQGAVRIDGKVEGDISAKEVVVGEQGHIQGNIEATSVIVAGKIMGNIASHETLELLSSAKVYGDIQAPLLNIAEGATFQGKCLMGNDGAPLNGEPVP